MLSREELEKRIHSDDLSTKLVVSPILDKEQQLGDCSIDLRLGNSFLIPKRNELSLFDPMKFELMEREIKRVEKEYVKFGSPFYLHPNKVILATTLEFLAIPKDTSARIVTRASYERLGIQIHTTAQPGYKGNLTLTLINNGNTPVILYPGTRIIQLSLFELENKMLEGYKGKYSFEDGPLFSKAHKDKDLEKIKKIKI